jgi:hypothetical protein
MATETKEERVYRYPGVFIEDRNGERRMATKVSVTYKWETAEGATLTRTYNGPALDSVLEEPYTDDMLFQKADHAMDWVSESHEGRGCATEKIRFDAKWVSSDTDGECICEPLWLHYGHNAQRRTLARSIRGCCSRKAVSFATGSRGWATLQT